MCDILYRDKLIVTSERNKSMKVCIVQPAYSTDYSLSEEYFRQELEFFARCDESMDIIVFPEACDVPCLTSGKEDFEASVHKFGDELVKVASETAKRCNAILFANGSERGENGLRNTTYAFDRQGRLVGKYYKQHLTPGEVGKRKLDSEYSFEFEEPTVVEIEGIRFGFLTCYDFYFYESFAHMARKNLDVIIGCSHQRSDTHEALEIMSRFLAYNTNAYVIRSSVSMDENSSIGGGSMVVSPDGRVLLNMYSRVGMDTVEIDVKDKYYKPAGYGNPPSAHYEYIEKGRRPWKYRPSGSAIVRRDDWMPYPRVCAHRGFNTVAPENSMPAFGAAVAMGAEEIEFDLWYTKDGEIVSIHDSKLDRVSDGTGRVYDYTYEELLKFDFGSKFGEEFKGLRILRFEDILKKFACHTIMNVHVKTVSNVCSYDEVLLKKIVDLVRKYDCEKYVYFMSGNDVLLKQLGELAPDIGRCVGGGDERWKIVDRAIELGINKVQLFKPYFNKEMIDKAHANGIRCNVFWSDDAEETKDFLEMGIDTILTNDYNRISQVVSDFKKRGKI